MRENNLYAYIRQGLVNICQYCDVLSWKESFYWHDCLNLPEGERFRRLVRNIALANGELIENQEEVLSQDS